MSKKTSKAQRRRNRDYWARKKRSRPQISSPDEQERLTSAAPIPQQGLRLPSAPQGRLYLMEAEDGSLVDVPEERMDEWMEMQGQEAESQQEDEEKQGDLIDLVMQMLYGGVEQDK